MQSPFEQSKEYHTPLGMFLFMKGIQGIDERYQICLKYSTRNPPNRPYHSLIIILFVGYCGKIWGFLKFSHSQITQWEDLHSASENVLNRDPAPEGEEISMTFLGPFRDQLQKKKKKKSMTKHISLGMWNIRDNYTMNTLLKKVDNSLTSLPNSVILFQNSMAFQGQKLHKWGPYILLYSQY